MTSSVSSLPSSSTLHIAQAGSHSQDKELLDFFDSQQHDAFLNRFVDPIANYLEVHCSCVADKAGAGLSTKGGE